MIGWIADRVVRVLYAIRSPVTRRQRLGRPRFYDKALRIELEAIINAIELWEDSRRRSTHPKPGGG